MLLFSFPYKNVMVNIYQFHRFDVLGMNNGGWPLSTLHPVLIVLDTI